VGDAILTATGTDSGADVVTAKTYASVADLTGHLDLAVNGVIAKYKALVAEFTKDDTSTSALVTSFGKLGHEGFDALTNAQKATVAQTFVTNYPTDKDGDKVDYSTLSVVKAALDTIIAGL